MKLRAELNKHAALVVQLLVFVVFAVLAARSLRGVSVLNHRVSNVAGNLSRLDDRTNDVDYYHRVEYDALAKQSQDLRQATQDLRNTLHNETSLIFPSLIKQAMPAVVGVTDSSNPINQINGSGFVIDAANGYIMTAKHVVDRSLRNTQYEIELTCGDRIAVKRIFKYIKDDLAILVVDTSDPNYCLVSELPIANPYRALRRGDIVIAIGHPFSILFSASAGIISNPNSKHIKHIKEGRAERIQLDMMLNPGNSGCAILDTQGNVIGVWVTGQWVVRQSAGVCFAVPIKTINDCIARFNEWLVSNE